MNWLWQGGTIALVSQLLLGLLQRARARDRYALCWASLLSVLALPIVPLVPEAVSASGSAFQTAAPASPFTLPVAWWTSDVFVLAIWAVWMVVSGIRLATALVALRRARRACTPFPAAVEAELACWGRVRARGRRATLALSTDVRAAAVLGFRDPLIAVAPSMLERLTTAEIDRAVIHEWAHVERRDDLLNLAQLAVLAVAGWHPAVWWLERQLRIEREAACDETAVSLTGSVKGYAACLAHLASLRGAGGAALPIVGVLSSPTLGSRVVRVLAHRHLVRPAWSAAAGLAAVVPIWAFSSSVAGVPMIGRSWPTTALAAPDQPPARLATPVPASWNRAVDAPELLAAPAVGPPAAATARVAATRRESAAPAAAGAPVTPIPAVQPPRLPGGDAPRQAVAPAASNGLGDIAPDILHPLESPSHPMALVAPLPPLSAASAMEESPATPWDAATDAGMAVGRGSQRAAVATAGFFSRVGRKLAGTF
jgi:D-alanyl-D-alanine endopeptidase (penicillin-binding protein 7)